MKLIALGTSSGVPTKQRNVSSHAVVFRDGSYVLFDCGEGTQQRLLQAKLSTRGLIGVFITHLHGDHFFGLPPLINSLSISGRQQNLYIHGPPGIRELLHSIVRLTSMKLGFAAYIRELDSGMIHDGHKFTVSCKGLEHRLPAFGYRLTEHGAPERTIVYCSDTKPSPSAIELARGADLLLHEATYTDEYAHKANEFGHSTASDAATIAAQAGVAKLVLTHFSPRFHDLSPLVAEAQKIFPNTEAAHDLGEIEINGRPVQVSA